MVWKQHCLYIWGLPRSTGDVLDSLLPSKHVRIIAEVTASSLWALKESWEYGSHHPECFSLLTAMAGKSWGNASSVECFGPQVAYVTSGYSLLA